MNMLEMIKAQLGSAVPFARHAGVALGDVAAGEASAELPETATSINHIGTQHAGALFTLGETASGAAVAGAFADQILSLRPVAAEATIAYRKTAKGLITARAKVGGDIDAHRSALAEAGRVAFDVGVSMTDANGVEVAAMTVKWHLRKL